MTCAFKIFPTRVTNTTPSAPPSRGVFIRPKPFQKGKISAISQRRSEVPLWLWWSDHLRPASIRRDCVFRRPNCRKQRAHRAMWRDSQAPQPGPTALSVHAPRLPISPLPSLPPAGPCGEELSHAAPRPKRPPKSKLWSVPDPGGSALKHLKQHFFLLKEAEATFWRSLSHQGRVWQAVNFLRMHLSIFEVLNIY